MKARRLDRSSWLVVTIAVAFTVPAVAADLPRVEDEALLALLNCGRSQAPSDWEPVAQWTFPGNYPKRTSLRAYHAVSFGSGRMNVDYMVCHLGWYRTVQEAEAAFGEWSRPVNRSPAALAVGDRAVFSESEVPAIGQQPRQVHNRVLMQRGPFLFEVGIMSVLSWPREKLLALLESIDQRLGDGTAPAGSHATEASKMDDPRRPPRCDRACWLHKQALTPVSVTIVYGYGLPSPTVELPEHSGSPRRDLSREYWEARTALFPNASQGSISGGCVVDELLAEHWFCACSVCIQLDAEWRIEHNYPARTH